MYKYADMPQQQYGVCMQQDEMSLAEAIGSSMSCVQPLPSSPTEYENVCMDIMDAAVGIELDKNTPDYNNTPGFVTMPTETNSPDYINMSIPAIETNYNTSPPPQTNPLGYNSPPRPQQQNPQGTYKTAGAPWKPSWYEDVVDIKPVEELDPMVIKQENDGSDSDGSDTNSNSPPSTTGSADPPAKRRGPGRRPIFDANLTPAEREKKERRRRQNRNAAKRCREKRKMHQDEVYRDYYRLKDEHARIQKENMALLKQVEQHKHILQAHQATCSLQISAQQQAIINNNQHHPLHHQLQRPSNTNQHQHQLNNNHQVHHHEHHVSSTTTTSNNHHHPQPSPLPPPYAAALTPPSEHSPLSAPSSAASTCYEIADEITEFVFEKSV